MHEYLNQDVRAQLEAVARRALSFAKADETRVTIDQQWIGQTRFAGAEITTSGGSVDRSLTVTSTIGRRRASAQTNVTDDASLQRTVDLAERLRVAVLADQLVERELDRQLLQPVLVIQGQRVVHVEPDHLDRVHA
jgi:predicted Zn-dependent protease